MSVTRTAEAIEELKRLVGEKLGVGPWLEMTRERVNAVADVTGDHQYIHVDPERAAATPFGGDRPRLPHPVAPAAARAPS
ncbi:MAG: MaoC/PaaZ C-terminal domain-containing protein [Gemmatimonadales bacterium]